MALVKKLYGVSDSGYITLGGMSIQEMFGGNAGSIATHVGKELREELMALPKKTKVGVQYFDEFCDGGIPYRRSIRIRGKQAHIPIDAANYWTEVLSICKMKSLDVVFLDSYKLLRDSSKMLIDREREAEGIKNLEKAIEKDPENMGMRRLRREQTEKLYNMEVEAEYMNTVTRGDKILEGIVKERPEIVLVGIGHADYFFANPELMKSINLKFEQYAKESYDTKVTLAELPEYMRRPPKVFGKLIRDAQPDKGVLAEREKVERQEKARTLGRILLSKGTPAWIGTWDTNIPAKGLFEVYTGEMIETFHGVLALKGKIEDTFGTSEFRGSMDDKTFIFQKQYDDLAVAMGGYKGPIKFETIMREDKAEELQPGVLSGYFTPMGAKPRQFLIREFKEEDPKLEKFRKK